MKKIRVMIVEDSAVVRALLEYSIGRDPRLEVCAAAPSAEDALRMIERITPDIIAMDIRLPGMDGLEATRRIMSTNPIPIVVVAASVESRKWNATAMEALRAGALTVLENPVGTTNADYETLAERLCTQLVIPQSSRRGPGVFKVVGITSSTGGPAALAQLLRGLGPAFPLPILLVQHMTSSFLDGFASWLGSVGRFPVAMAHDGCIPVAGTVHIAPAERHLRMDAGRLRLDAGDPIMFQRPSGTVLFQSMARELGVEALGVILTGMGGDGASGLLDIHRAGGYTIAEDESTAVVYGMPAAAVGMGAVCESLPLRAIASRLRELVSCEMNSPCRILIVEDSETQAYKLCLLLAEQGWRCSAAGTAEEALATLGDPLPDLLLVDYNLPGMRGDEFCRRIRMNMNTRGIPILMMTASAPGAAEISSLDSGADDYISKSDSAETMLLRIRTLLRKVSGQTSILRSQDSDFRPARILVIDDSPTYLAFIHSELRNQGYEVEAAASAGEGLSRLMDEIFDCVLVDLVMPEMDGIEMCRRMAAVRQGLNRGVAVIILSGSANPGDLNRGLEAGADDFVTKSSDLAVLRARIQALMRRKFFQDENGRIVEELKARELETLRAQAGRQIAESRAAMAERLVEANRELQEVNRKLKETQFQLIQNEKMASLGQLVAGIAHEINNPLAFVVNNLFLVENGLDGIVAQIEPHLPEPSLIKLGKARARLGEMREGLDRVKELVLDLRTFSRLDRGKFNTVDVVESIEAVLLLLKYKMNGRIVVEKRYAAERKLHCYSGRLHQVFMNLIGKCRGRHRGGGNGGHHHQPDVRAFPDLGSR